MVVQGEASEPDHNTAAQLAVLEILIDCFAAARMRFWLRGGWAVDFTLGRVTRRHSDIDLVTWQRHRRRVRQVLTDAGLVPVQELEAQTDFRARDQTVSVVYLERLSDRRVITYSIPVWEWPEGSLSSGCKRLGDLAARVMSPEQMLWEKEGYERGTGRPPRPKDFESMRVLREMIAGT